jgi:DNA-binding response OmpR family regulator
MADFEFRAVQVTLIDRELTTRRLLRGILSRLGVEALREYATLGEGAIEVMRANPDLLIIDVDQGAGEGFKFISNLRNGLYDLSPFVCVLATTWQPTPALLGRFASSGADDLLVKPFSVNQVADRLSFMIEGRKPFVVTSDYVGPDRRKGAREGIQIPLIDVPNTLRRKAIRDYAPDEVDQHAEAAARAINDQKILRCGFQIAFLVEFAVPGLSGKYPNAQAIEHLMRVPAMIDEVSRRLRKSDLEVTADRYAIRLIERIQRVQAAQTSNAEDAAAMRSDAYGLMALTQRTPDTGRLEREVTGAVMGYRNRLEQRAQQIKL